MINMPSSKQHSLQLLAICIIFLYFSQPALCHNKTGTGENQKKSSSSGGSSGSGSASGDINVNVALKGSFSQVIAFGDSYTDTGNCMFMSGLKRIFGGMSAHNSPYGALLSKAKTGNRFCDGRLVIDFLCDALGLPPLPPYKDPQVNVTFGVNFAVSGSTSLSSDLLGKYKIGQCLLWKSMVSQSFMKQLDWFDEFLEKMAASGQGSVSGSAGGTSSQMGSGQIVGGAGGGSSGGGQFGGSAGGGASSKGQVGGRSSGSGQVGGGAGGSAGSGASGSGQSGGGAVGGAGGSAGGGASGSGYFGSGASGSGQWGGGAGGGAGGNAGGGASGSGQFGASGSAQWGGGAVGGAGGNAGGGASGSGQFGGGASASGQYGGSAGGGAGGSAGGGAGGSAGGGGGGSGSGSSQFGGGASGSGQFGGSARGNGQASGSAGYDIGTALFWLGAAGVNDYARIISRHALTGNWLSQLAVNHQCKILKGLLDRGAKYIVVQGLPPVGCLPLALSFAPQHDRDQHGCSETINSIVKFHNQLLQKRIAEFQAEHKDCIISFADYFGAYKSILADAAGHQFQEPMKACCGAGTGPFNFSPNSLCGVGNSQKCPDPSKHIVWDGLHLTEAMHKSLADLFFNKGFCNPPIHEMVAHKNKCEK